MMRNIGATILGIVVQSVTVGVCEAIGHSIWPPSGTMDMNDPASMTAVVVAMPLGAKISVVAGWGLGTLLGAATAARVGTGRGHIRAGVVGGLQLLAVGINFAMIREPAWMGIVGLVQTLPLAWLGAKLVGRN